jgi:hypothetical protein
LRLCPALLSLLTACEARRMVVTRAISGLEEVDPEAVS